MRGRSGRSGSTRGGYSRRYNSGGRSYGASPRQTRQGNRDFRRGVIMGMGTSRMMRRRRRPFMMMGRRHSGGGLLSFIITLILLLILFNLFF